MKGLQQRLRPIRRLCNGNVHPIILLLRVHEQVESLTIAVDLIITHPSSHYHRSDVSGIGRNWDKCKGLNELVVDQELENTHYPLVLCLCEHYG